MKQELINYVNVNSPMDQWISFSPDFTYGYEGYVLFCRYEEGSREINHFKALDVLLGRLYPSINCLEFRAVERLIEMTEYSDHNYHRSFNMIVEYIKINQLTELIDEFKNKNIL